MTQDTETVGNPLINLGDISKPATMLIEKVSDAVGGIAKPWQIKRVAKAQASAELVRAKSLLEVSELEERALQRMIKEEAKNQDNIESITAKSIPKLTNESSPDKIEDDWLINFFDKAKLVSDQDMQHIWSSMLAGQANVNGSFSRRTVNLVSTFDKSDAELFTKFCSLVWQIRALTPVILDADKLDDGDGSMNLASLNHLESIGLINLQVVGGFARTKLPEELLCFYYQKAVVLQFPSESDNQLQIGVAMLTFAGTQLATICGSKPNKPYYENVLQFWCNLGLMPFEPINPIASAQSSKDSWYLVENP